MTECDPPSPIATEIASAIAGNPSHPISVWWLIPDFPTAVAIELLNQGSSIAWVVGSIRRADAAEEAFNRVGIRFRRPETQNSMEARLSGIATRYVKQANPFETPRADRKANIERAKKLKGIDALRVRFKQNFSEKDIGSPEAGTITILQASHLKSSKVLAAIAGWNKPVFVLDHLTDVHIRWKAAGYSEDDDTAERIYTEYESRHLPKVLTEAGLPHVYLLRDEWARLLLRAHFQKSGISSTELKTEFRPSSKLNITTFDTDLGQSKYDGATCLALKTSDPGTAPSEGVQIVGTGVFAAISPNALSMSGEGILRQAVLKVSYPAPADFAAVREQAPSLEGSFAGIRARDHVRTAMLAFDSASRKPELVILAASNMMPHIKDLAGPATKPRLGWPLSKKLKVETILPAGTRFQASVLETLLDVDGCLLRGNRAERIMKVLRGDLEKLTSDEDAFVERSARLLLGIQNILCEQKLDFSTRDEESWGLSKPCDDAIRLVNRFFTEVLPWSPNDTSTESRKTLDLRREILALYRERRANSLK